MNIMTIIDNIHANLSSNNAVPNRNPRRSPGREATVPSPQPPLFLIPGVFKGAAAPWHTDLASKV